MAKNPSTKKTNQKLFHSRIHLRLRAKVPPLHRGVGKAPLLLLPPEVPGGVAKPRPHGDHVPLRREEDVSRMRRVVGVEQQVQVLQKRYIYVLSFLDLAEI